MILGRPDKIALKSQFKASVPDEAERPDWKTVTRIWYRRQLVLRKLPVEQFDYRLETA
jgi:hypothetical protein